MNTFVHLLSSIKMAMCLGLSLLVMPVSTAEEEECISFETALFLATKNSPRVDSAEAGVEGATADLMIARSLQRPQVSTFVQSAAGEQGLVASDFNNQLGVRASQRLFDFGDAKLAKRAALVAKEASEFEKVDSQNFAALSLGMQYLDWLQAAEEIAITRERLSYFKREVNALEKALDLGGATRTDIAELRAEQFRAMSTNAQLELRRQNAKTAIAVLIGNSDPICEHFPKAFFFSKPDPSRDGFELEDLLVAAIANNPALQALAATSAQSRYLAERQSRERLPVIELVGIASLSANDFRTTTEPQYRVGIDVSVPIYAGSALVGRKRSASASAQGAQAAYQIERLELERRIRETVQSLLFLSAQIGHQIKVVASREDQFEAVTDEYRGGVSTLSVLVDARIDLEADSLALVRARFDRRRAHLSLLADLGLLVE